MSDCKICGGRYNPSKGVHCAGCGGNKIEDFYNELPVCENGDIVKSPISGEYVDTRNISEMADKKELDDVYSTGAMG